ncbi:hypothetical protein ACFXGA_30980, partial [Actinosynnema sp. NPDC059335]
MRVVLGEDLVLLRDGLIRLLEAYDFDVVEAVDSGPALLKALVDPPPQQGGVVSGQARPGKHTGVRGPQRGPPKGDPPP